MSGADDLEQLLQMARNHRRTAEEIGIWDFVEWPELKQKEFLLLMVLQQAEWANRIHRFLEARFGQTSSRENPE